MQRGVACRSGIVARGSARGRSGRTGMIGRGGRGSGWRRCLTRARRRGGSTAGLPGRDRGLRVLLRPGTTGSPAVGQVGQAEPGSGSGRLRAPWDPVAGRYRAPDEKTIRVCWTVLTPRALTRALLGASAPAAVAGRVGRRARLPLPAGRRAGQKHWPAAGCGRWRGRQDLPRSPPHRRHPGFTSWRAEHGGHLLDHC